MDSFEPIREEADRRRAQLALDAKTPSMDVIRALLHKDDIHLTLLAPGNVALVGARAVFDEQFRAICAEEVEDEGGQATLVAHEFAHSVLHVSSAQCRNDDIDPSRPTEVAQVGVQRVDSYGARERRELQANVFAREVLLPRTVAKRLHYDEAMSATAIAETLRLPKDLVRQQILDALLLPSAPAEQEPTGEQASLPDPTQEDAATHRQSAFLLQAGPGTGKTRTLIKRVLSLLDEGHPAASILVLTFSNRAAAELFERVSKAAPLVASKIWIGTFHAFGLDLIRRYYDKLHLAPNPPLFDRSDAIEVLQDLLPTLPLVHYRNLWDPLLDLKDIIGAISRAKDEVIDAAAYRRLAEATLGRAADVKSKVDAEKCLEIAEVYDRYQVALGARSAVDFGDLIMRPALLLESDPVVRAEVRLRHLHVLVDEYQDVNRASARLLRAIAGDGKRLWAVGDARQSIYRFRGASPANVRSFATDYEGSDTGQLGVSYRSSKEIIDILTAFSPGMGASTGALPLQLASARGPTGDLPEIRVLETPDDEEGGVAAAVRELEAKGVALRAQAVLCRTNRRLNEIANALEARGIPVLHLGSFFERSDVRDLLALLSLAVDRSGSGLVRVGTLEAYPLSLQDVWAATRDLQGAEKGSAMENLDVLASSARLSAPGRASIERLRRDLSEFTVRTSPWEFLTTYLLDRTRYVADLSAQDTIRARMQSIALWQLLNFVRQPRPAAAGLPIRRMLEQVRQLVLLAEERDLRHIPAGAVHMNAVRLMTVHAAKGLEFEAVHIPGVTKASFPLGNRAAPFPTPDGLVDGGETFNAANQMASTHDEEEECLFFVAMSRARGHLRLYRATRQANGSARNPSPYLLGLPLREIPTPATISAPGNDASSAICVTWPDSQTLSASQIESFAKCPRRFFYTHVLGLAMARTPTPFTRAERCLFKLIAWLAKARLAREVTVDDAKGELERIWSEHGPTDHAFAEDYRRLALRLTETLARRAAGERYQEPAPLPVEFPTGTVVVEPNEIAELADGAIVVRLIQTGRKRSKEYERLVYSLCRLGVRIAFGARGRVEALHLTSDLVENVEIKDKTLEDNRAQVAALLKEIGEGQYPPNPDAFRCPRCPHFFICAATPHGRLELAGRDSK